ncbi:MAG: aminotransferase class I and II, partial [Polyangia bacterium]
ARTGEHVLLPFADRLAEAGARMGAALDDARVSGIVAAVPDGWLGEAGEGLRAAYLTWLQVRRAALPRILDEANRVRAARV